MRAIAHVVPAAIAELLRSTPPSPGKIQFAWNAVVGPAVQRATAVLLEGDVLYVDAQTTQWARELTRSSHMILARLQSLLGAATVTRMVVRAPGAER
jgi:predicted nucleic acid-binding Zn ribbon protein